MPEALSAEDMMVWQILQGVTATVNNISLNGSFILLPQYYRNRVVNAKKVFDHQSVLGVTHSYVFLLFNVYFYQGKMLMFCNVHTTNSTFSGLKMRCTVNGNSVA